MMPEHCWAIAACTDRRTGRGRWTIVGIEVSLGDASEQVVIDAADPLMKPVHDEGVDVMVVTDFHLGSSTRVDDFLHEAFDRVNLRLMSTLVVDRYLPVDDHVQSPTARQ
jgi:hypothetical protein